MRMHRAGPVVVTLLVALAASAGPARAQDESSPAAMPPGSAKFPTLDVPADATAVPGVPPPMAFVGSLAIHAVQGTPDAPPVGVAEVQVELLHRGMVVQSLRATLDEHGVAMIEDIALEMSVQPSVQVAYAGVTYHQTGTLMDAENPQQRVDVVCYEVTEEKPEWTVKTRHMMVSPDPAGMRVTELVDMDNPTSQTWLGEPVGDDKRATVVLDVPAGAKNVELGLGFHGWCCTTRDGSRLVNHQPLMPGSTRMRFSYVLPAEEGAASLKLTTPAPTEHLMVIVPEPLSVDVVEGLEAGSMQSMGDAQATFYTARGLAGGQQASLTVSGLATPAIATVGAAAETTTASGAGAAKWIAFLGGGLMVLIAVVIIFRRSSQSAAG